MCSFGCADFFLGKVVQMFKKKEVDQNLSKAYTSMPRA